jgi:GH24 family phage-related lysozyme (muramidase)
MDITLFQKWNIPAEAERGRVYDDATGRTIGPGTTVIGNPTIAIGRNVGPTGPGIRESEMFSMLSNDEDEVEGEAKAFAWYPSLNLVRQTVVCSMIFNMGLNKFDGFVNLKAALAAGDWQRSHDEMLASKWAKDPPIGVGDRAKTLAAAMLSGVAS